MRQGSKGKVLVVSLVGAVILAVGVFMGIRWSDGADAPRTGSRPGSSDGARLLAEIEKYRQGAARMAPEQAVSTWFELFGRASRIGADSQPGDATAFDTLSMAPVGHETMLAALPPPPAWRAFRDEAARRTNSAKASEDLLAVR